MRKVVKKGLLCLMLSGVLTFSVAGCGKSTDSEQVTEQVVDSKIETLFTDSNNIYKDISSISLSLDIKSENGNVNLNLKSDNNGVYREGTVNDKVVKIYNDLENKVNYSYNSDKDTWFLSENSFKFDIKSIGSLDFSSMYDKLTIKEGKFNKEDVYLVCGAFTGYDLDVISSQVDVKLSDYLVSKDEVVNVALFFRKEDSRLLGIQLKPSENNNYSLLIDFKDINNFKFEVPSDVVEKE